MNTNVDGVSLLEMAFFLKPLKNNGVEEANSPWRKMFLVDFFLNSCSSAAVCGIATYCFIISFISI